MEVQGSWETQAREDRDNTHITLNSGHSRQSARSEIRDDIITLVSDLITRALAGEKPPLPQLANYYLTGTRDEGALVVTVWRNATPKGQLPQRVPIATIGVAIKDGDKALELWHTLHLSHKSQEMPLATAKRKLPPAAPWCAARLDPGVTLFPDTAGWMGDFERCLAWAWVEMVGKERRVGAEKRVDCETN